MDPRYLGVAVRSGGFARGSLMAAQCVILAGAVCDTELYGVGFLSIR